MSPAGPRRWQVATSVGAPAAVCWRVVGDLTRLAEWTDAEPAGVDAPPRAAGDRLAARVGRRRVTLEVTRLEGTTVEVVTDDLDAGRLGLGAHVAAEPRGSRLVVAYALHPRERAERLRAPAAAVALRRRLERWALRAADAAWREARRD